MGAKKKQRKRAQKAKQAPPIGVSPPGRKRRAYASAGGTVGRLVGGSYTSSANAELHHSLTALRNRSRALMRDNVIARRAKRVTVNNVIGAGIGQQAQVMRATGSKALKTVNADIDAAWRDWCAADHCHLSGAMHFHDIERLAFGEVFEAGEVLIRVHRRAVGSSKVPLSIEVIEAERLADDYEITPPAGMTVEHSIAFDSDGRPAFYYIHSADVVARGLARQTPNKIEAVPARDIYHLFERERWPQARGVPKLHAAIVRLDQSDKFDHAALTAAVIGASKVGFYEPTEELDAADSLVDENEGTEADGTPLQTIKPGQFQALPYGYKFTSFDPAYPHEVYEPFTRASDRKIAAGTDVPYEDLTQDYSQSNYSSSRMSNIAARDTWRAQQAWWIRTFREPLHKEWLQAAVLSRAVSTVSVDQYMTSTERFEAVRFKPRGWQFSDPQKDVAANKEAEAALYTTKTDIVAEYGNGRTLEEIIETRKRELQMLADAGLTSDTAALLTAPPATDDARPVGADDDAGDGQAGDSVDDAPPGGVVPIKGGSNAG